jgi:hypothetical protein
VFEHRGEESIGVDAWKKKMLTWKKKMLTWPPTTEDFQHYMQSALAQSEKTNVKALVFCDNPGLIIFDPITSTIRSQYQTAKAETKDGKRTVEIIIAEVD